MKLRTDTELLDFLERTIKEEPLTLWEGTGKFPGGITSGLSLLSGRRSLREALTTVFHEAEPASKEEL